MYVPLDELAAHPEKAAGTEHTSIGVSLPRVAWDREWPQLLEQLRRARALGVEDALAGNLGMLSCVKELGFTLRGDFGLEVYNSQALKQLKRLGLRSAAVSFELKLAQIRDLSKAVDTELIAYGRLPLMLLRNCPGKTAAGCGDCRGINHITDRRGEDFPLQCQNRQYTHLLNPRPLFLSDRLPEWDFCDFLTLRFTTETPAECDAILEMYQTGAAPAGPFTRGLYYRTLK